MREPHIIFIMTDQHRFDALGCSGNAAIKTPNLDALASLGVLFTSAYSAVPSCTPSRACLLTGMSPWHHGMLGYGRIAEHYRYEMPRMLEDLGYHALGVGKMHFHPQRALHGFHETVLDESSRSESPGFISDYRQWFKQVAPGKDPDATGIGWNDNKARNYALDENMHPTRWTGDVAVQKIKEHDPVIPFFLKISFARPHSPYDAPKRLVDAYKLEDMPAPWIGSWCKRFRKPDAIVNGHARGDFGVDFAREARRHYYGNVTFIDEQIGRVVAALKEKGMYDDSLILFTSDHGDMLGDHHHWRKTYGYEGSAHIPMILTWPAWYKAAIARGSKLQSIVELRDVLPTFLFAAGGKVPGDMDGKSLLALVSEDKPAWREYIDMEHETAYDPRNYWMGLTDGKHKYIFFRPTGKEQFFDLERDPHEEHDLAKDKSRAQELALWRSRLAAHFQERGPKWVKNGKLRKSWRSQLYSPNYPK
nr:arylsulfatase [Candidatus Sigynarchaeota archaeon]